MYQINDVKGLLHELLEVMYALPWPKNTLTSRVYMRVITETRGTSWMEESMIK